MQVITADKARAITSSPTTMARMACTTKLTITFSRMSNRLCNIVYAMATCLVGLVFCSKQLWKKRYHLVVIVIVAVATKIEKLEWVKNYFQMKLVVNQHIRKENCSKKFYWKKIKQLEWYDTLKKTKLINLFKNLFFFIHIWTK